jgi:hypothetical protein
MKTLRVLLGTLLVASAAPALAADVTGDWRVTISTADETITGMGSLKQTGDKVTGWVGPDEHNQIPIDGVVDGNSLTITTHPQPGRTVAFDKCHLTVNGDRMAGTIEPTKGTIEFVRAVKNR